MLVVVIALFITVNIANECILFTWKTSRAYDKYNYLITFYVDGRVLHFRRHAVMATLFLLIYYVPHTLDISVSCDCW